MAKQKKFKRILVANRGEIAIRIFRACNELGIRSVAIYSEEDKNTLFRTKADQSYQIGKGKAPVDAYLAIDEIIELAKSKGIDAIHPGYGFLAENTDFAKACEEEGIVFIGPDYHMMDQLGDKVKSKIIADSVGVPTIPGIAKTIPDLSTARKFAKECGYPVMLKAAGGGGGRGMRVVRKADELEEQFESARSEAAKAFGNDDIFIEKYVERPKHIEVQVLGDNYGNVVHLAERDCSIQRRHQKVVEFTPALSISKELREKLCSDAIKIAKAVDYRSAGTVEFLIDKDDNHYFIEMNPRIQVEHTVTEMTTGIDLVQSQILIAEGYKLNSPELNIRQRDIKPNGYAIQCRLTTEDPLNDFMPDTGVITRYISPGGYGIRLDAGNAQMGAEISPYYDSLLVKVTSWSRSWEDAANKASRALKELKLQGVKSNRTFLLNVLNHEQFRAGTCDTGFIEDNPELLQFKPKTGSEFQILNFLGDKYVNGNRGIKPQFDKPVFPKFGSEEIRRLKGTKQLLDSKGPEAVADWVKKQKKLLITDTSMRDAQQSLMATRVRTADMEKIAPAVAVYGKDLFSLEIWGGATFDTAYRFLGESPWERLETLREKIPNIMLQMLIRGANAVGYKNYPDNVIRSFVKESAKTGIDVFRIFDSLNWIQGMEVALDETLNQGKLAEACICYTGDILDKSRTKYNLKYYVEMAKELERRGTHILGIKDMSGLLKPMAAKVLIEELKQEIGIPIHLHTHDTSGNGVATLMMATNAGCDIVDAAFNSLSGLTSQPALNSIAAALEGSERDTGINIDGIQEISDYWAAVRPVYKQFESDMVTGSAEIYKYEMPGGQYSNMKSQVESFGLGHKFRDVKEMYKTVNEMLGDIVKVTPSSKAVGDMAIFMVQNDLTPDNIYEKAANMDFPDSIVSYFEGMMGQPEGGFPEKLQKLVLRDKEPITCRPGTLLEDEDFEWIRKGLQDNFGLEGTEQEVLSYAIYPKVYEDYLIGQKKNGKFRYMGSDIFFHGLSEGETCEVKVREGRELVIRLSDVRETDEEGYRDVIFEVNGNRSAVRIKDQAANISGASTKVVMADEDDPMEIGANIPGSIIKLLVKEGEEVEEAQPVAVIEAMKMETKILATSKGIVDEIFIKAGQQVQAGELVVKLK